MNGRAREIRDPRADGMLATEFAFDQAAVAQKRPQLRFRVGLILAAFASAANGVGIAFTR
jgi:hypothetical protein